MSINKFFKQVLLIVLAMFVSTTTFAAKLTADTAVNIPIGGNGWLSPNAKAQINNEGLINWTSPDDVLSVYLRLETAGTLDILLNLRVLNGTSKLSVTALGQTFTNSVSQTKYGFVYFGKVAVKQAGYIKIDIRGISKTGDVFAEVADIIAGGTAMHNGPAYVMDNKGNYFYWGHRGPSVHLNYAVPEAVKSTTEWFYNEVTVPVGSDIIGSYYMADGFSGGYFGMQVNSADTRRVLFSVWSPYTTDDPKTIPENLKVKLLKKGDKTHGGEFGGEGSGGQSYMNFPWVAGKTYCFLIHAQGDIAAETTIYTAYFKPLDSDEWILVASFKRPQSGSYLKGLHSFLENFDPKNGDKTRKVLFGNQWTVDIEGKWYPLNDALFTGDNTAKMNYRKDYAGGVQDRQFYLKNCGFFDDFTVLKTPLKKEASSKPHPQIDFSKLP
jgi:hypothetical protein